MAPPWVARRNKRRTAPAKNKFPDIFPDIFAKAFFVRAALEDPRTGTVLLRVCKTVHNWVLPVLYEVVYVTKLNSTPLLKALEISTYRDRLDGVLKALHVAYSVEMKISGAIQLHLQNYTHLQLCITLPCQSLTLQPHRTTHLTFAISPEQTDRPGLQMAEPCVRHVTHLCYMFYWLRPADTSPFAALPCLTHLALVMNLKCDPPSAVRLALAKTLHDCRSLELCVVLLIPAERDVRQYIEYLGQVDDDRLVVMLHQSYDWEKIVTGRKGNMWDLAEEVSARKKADRAQKLLDMAMEMDGNSNDEGAQGAGTNSQT